MLDTVKTLTHMSMRNPLKINDAFEQLLELIQIKHDENEQSLSDLLNKYDAGEIFDNDDDAMINYYEGATEALGLILYKGKELYGQVH